MADSFFGFDTSLGAALDDGLDCLDDEDFEENNYDALNDETFGSAISEDWEQDHEKLSQITESNRPRLRNENNKSDTEIDVEKSLSHLVLDEREVTIPRPGVWDSPTNFPIPPPQIPPPKPPSLSAALKNACTVEELERGLMANRPPPGLIKQPVLQQQPPNSGANLFLSSIASVEKLNQQINGVAPPQAPNHFPAINSPLQPLNLRLPPKFFGIPPNVQPLLNQHENLLRCPPIRPPHMWPSGPQRPPLHGNFPPNNLPINHPLNSGMGPYPFLRPGHPLIPPYGNNHQSMQQHNMHMNMLRNQNNKFNNHNDHQPFFRNNQFHHQNQMNRFFNNQGFMGHMHMANHHHFNSHVNGMGIGPYGELDEYAGLMNNREKQWLNNIQLLQLNTNQPYVDDYYYTVFCDRMNKKNENRNKNQDKKSFNGKGGNNNNNNNGFHRDSRDKEQSTFTTKPANTPMQFENSLGKLQYSSVTAPRKIIDMDVVPNSDPQTLSVQQKDTKRTRQLLLEIERLYILLLKLEDKSNPLAILADQQREQQLKEQQQQQIENGEPVTEPEVKDPIKEKEELTLSLTSSFVQLIQEDKFSSFLSIRKGKMLFQRFLACIDMKNDTERLPILWNAMIRNLAVIGRRDSHLLINFYPEFQKWVDANSTNHMVLANLAKEFTESSSQPSKTNSLAFALTNKFGISVLAVMLKQTSDQRTSPSFSEYWTKFVRAIADSLISGSTPVVAPCDCLDSQSLRVCLRAHGLDSELHMRTFELFFTEANPVR